MSGCVHCVYTIYADDLEIYTDSLKSARKALSTASIPPSDWPEEVREHAGEEDGIKVDAKKEVMSNVDPSMAAFLA